MDFSYQLTFKETYLEGGEVNIYYGGPPQAKEGEFFGIGWMVRKHEGRFYFSYISGAHEGKEKEIEISMEDYELACAGKLGMREMCMKYNVY